MTEYALFFEGGSPVFGEGYIGSVYGVTTPSATCAGIPNPTPS